MRQKNKENTIVYDLRHACDDMDNNRTRASYVRGSVGFGGYLREQGINKVSKIPAGRGLSLLQGYADALITAGKRPDTIHSYLAGACHALGRVMGEKYNLGDIKKPKRGRSVKGRDFALNSQGKAEAAKPENARLIAFANSVGIRRSEYGKVDGRSFKPDESGYMCIWVKGKGGKSQAQRILPFALPVVAGQMSTIRGKQHLFSAADLDNKIDLHSIRRAVARRSYDYYKHRCNLDPRYRDQLRQELIRRYDAMHPTGYSNDETTRDRYIRELTGFKGKYVCRGDNAAALREQGREVSFDRLCLMAVSVFHLSHWRSDVTVKHYMI